MVDSSLDKIKKVLCGQGKSDSTSHGGVRVAEKHL